MGWLKFDLLLGIWASLQNDWLAFIKWFTFKNEPKYHKHEIVVAFIKGNPFSVIIKNIIEKDGKLIYVVRMMDSTELYEIEEKDII